MIAYIDLDGVLVDAVNGMCRFHGIENPYLKKENAGQWHIHKRAGMRWQDFWPPLNNFEFWASLPKTEECDEIIATVEQYGFEIAIATSHGNMPMAAAGKVAWCQQHLKYKCIPIQEKWRLANPNTLLIDDSDKNIVEFVQHGGHGLLLPRPWNKSYEDDPMVAFHGEIGLYA